MLEKLSSLNCYILFICTVISYSTLANTISYWATAIDLQTNQIIYREKHTETYSGNIPTSFLVQYFKPNGQEFATKRVQFVNTNYDPDINLSYPNLGYNEFTKHLKENTYRVGHTKKSTRTIQYKELSVNRTAVIDNGFDLYIKENMPLLKQGKYLHFDYIAPARLAYYHFRLKPSAITSTRITIKIESDNMLIRLLTQPIIVEYDTIQNRLISYQGITNIPKKSGGNHRAKLIVNYG